MPDNGELPGGSDVNGVDIPDPHWYVSFSSQRNPLIMAGKLFSMPSPWALDSLAISAYYSISQREFGISLPCLLPSFRGTPLQAL